LFLGSKKMSIQDWYCCGQLFQDGAFCSECGKPKPDVIICQNCDKEIKRNDSFCKYCGTKALKSSKKEKVKNVESSPELREESSSDRQEKEPPNKKPKIPEYTARMFHPHNGREDFDFVQPTPNLLRDAIVYQTAITPLALQYLEEEN
jgi:DNA-directed RNA polymerase subunit RPC12/RpoP